MSEEVYVSFETAKLLKEKGFDWKTTECYSPHGGNYRFSHGIAEICGIEQYPRPTQQMACKWLRETHGLWVIPMPCENGECYFEIYKRYGEIWKNDVYDHTEYEDFDEPEYAVEAALQYCLTNLI